MLAVQCNKLNNKSSPPLAETLPGKGFYPWRKSPLGGSGSQMDNHNSPSPLSTCSQRSSSIPLSSTPSSMPDMGYSNRPMTTSSASSSSVYSSPSDLYFSSTPATPTSVDSHSHSHSHSHSLTHSPSAGFLGKMEAGGHHTLAPVYGRHPYESWPFNAVAGAPHHGAINSGELAINPAASWWDVHGGAAAPASWLDMSAGMHVQMPGAAAANYATVASVDYTALSHSLAAAPAHHLLPSAQHLLSDAYKPVIPSAQSSFGVGAAHHRVASTPPPAPVAATAAAAQSSAGGPTHATRPHRRYAERSSCECPNCQEADRLSAAGAPPRQKNVHSCHIPGCGKVYGKTSHLKAHLRWHFGDRPFVCNWLLCGKRFTRANELQSHVRTHTAADKRFACPVCEKRFNRAADFAAHVKTHGESGDKKAGSQNCADAERHAKNELRKSFGSPDSMRAAASPQTDVDVKPQLADNV